MTRPTKARYLVAMYRAVAVVLASLVLLVPVASAKPRLVIVGASSMAGFPTKGTVAEATKIFGQPSSRLGTYDTCRLTWPGYGIVMQSYYTNGALDPCGPSAKHKSSTVTGHGWSTSKGLAVGDPLSKLRHLYPKAQKQSATKWQLISRSFAGLPVPGLEATLKRGRIVSFTVYGPPSSF